MRRLASLSFAVLLATASVPALNGPAHAGLRLSPKIIEVLPDIANLLDAGIDITTNDVPGVVGSDMAPHTYAQQVAKVHFGHEFPKEPAIDGDRLFSGDAAERAKMRKEYSDFVGAEAKDIERIKARREDRAAALKKFEGIYDRLRNFANSAPDLIDAASKVPVANETLPAKIAGQLLSVTQVMPDFADIVTEYGRLVKEYDAAIKDAWACCKPSTSSSRRPLPRGRRRRQSQRSPDAASPIAPRHPPSHSQAMPTASARSRTARQHQPRRARRKLRR
mgnify:CR=1 FL=1